MCPMFLVLLLLATASVAGSRRCHHTLRKLRKGYPCQPMQELLKMEQTVNDCCFKEDGRPMYCCFDGLFDELRDPLLNGNRMPLWDCKEKPYNVSQERIIGAIRCAQRKMNATDICRMNCCEAFWNEDATETHCSKMCMRLSSFTALSRREHLEQLLEEGCDRNGGHHFLAFEECLLLPNDDDDDEKRCVARVLQG